ncbi:hypothetical protein ACFLQ4_01705 [Bacteroidota bacterium]
MNNLLSPGFVGAIAACSVLTIQPVNFTWSMEYALIASDEGEKTLKFTYLEIEEGQK